MKRNPLAAFAELESDILARVVALLEGKTVQAIGVRRFGDDDGDLAFAVLLDPLVQGVGTPYEPREDEDAQVFHSSDHEELEELLTQMREEHEDEEADDYPGSSYSRTHGKLTAYLDRFATALAAKSSAPVRLLDAEAVPISERDRRELRDWVKAGCPLIDEEEEEDDDEGGEDDDD